MHQVIISIIMGFVCLIFNAWQVDDNNTTFAYQRLNDSVNMAAHDASLQIDKNELKNGRLVFDTANAEIVFKQTLAKNLSLNDQLQPKPNSLFRQDLNIFYVDYIDDLDGVTYPFYYENNSYGIHKWIYGPAVVFGVNVERPRVFNVNPIYDLVKWSVFEYPVP